MKKLHMLCVIMLCIAMHHVSAQTISRSVYSSAGETFIKGNTSITFCIGEPVSGLLSSQQQNKFLTTGFLQPDPEIQETINAEPGSINLFPNPSAGNTINLVFTRVPDGNYQIELFNIPGQLFKTINISYQRGAFLYLPLDISLLKPGNYFIKLNGQIFSAQQRFIKL